jgi:hypothetical protein
MTSVTPLERIRKVYKDKVDAHEKFSIGNISKEMEQMEQIEQMEQMEQMGQQMDEIEEKYNLEEIEVSAEELKAKRDIKFNSAFMESYSTQFSLKNLNEHQYRIRLSNKSMEVDNM